MFSTRHVQVVEKMAIRLSTALRNDMLGNVGMKGRFDRPDVYIELRFVHDKTVLWRQALPRGSVLVRDGKFSFPLSASFELPNCSTVELQAIRFVIAQWHVESINPVVESFEELISCKLIDFTIAGGLYPGNILNVDQFDLILPL